MVRYRTLRKELRREIRASRNRFLSIFVMVALGVLFLVGLRSAAPDMRRTADAYFDESSLYDVEILSTLGLTEEDLAAFSQAEGVENAVGGWSLDAIMTLGEAQRTVKLLSLSEDVNRPTLLEGRLPEAADECAVDRRLSNVQVGDVLTLAPGGDQEDALTGSAFTVTGVVNSPLYISVDRGSSTLGDGSVSGFVLLRPESFTLDYYTVADITAPGAAALDAYGSEYDSLIEDLTDRLETLAENRAALRYGTLLSDAQTEIDDGQAELDEARDEAQAEIDDGQAQLDDARQELDDGWAELEDARAEYDQGVADGQAELDDARQELDEGWSELAEAKDKLISAQAELGSQRADAEAQLQEARQALNNSEYQLTVSQAELDAGAAQLEELRQQTETYAMALAWQEAQIAAARGEGYDPSALPSAQVDLNSLDSMDRLEGIGSLADMDSLEGIGSLDSIGSLDDMDDLPEAALPTDSAAMPYNQETLTALQAALAEAEASLAEGQAQWDAGRAQLDAGWSSYYSQYNDAMNQLDEAQSEIDSGWSDYQEALQELTDGEADYAKGLADYESEIADAAQQIADAEQELADGEQEYADGLRDLEAAREDLAEQVADGQAELDEAREKLADLKPADVYVLDRNSNYGFVSYDQNATRMENLARVFPVIFFVVAALVCLTTMTRMVEEERTQIGSIKAMGYGTGAIAAKYLGYGVLAAAGGSVAGIAIGATLIPWVIFTSYGIMYTLENLELKLYWGLCLISALAGIACTVAATLWAMLSTARQSPATLMRPKAPRAGKRILLERVGPVWRRMSFSMKVSARNLFRYKKRFWMTVIGVAGCTSLLIAGLGLRSSIFNIIDIQFGVLYRYDVQLTLDDEEPDAPDAVNAALEASGNLDSLAAIHSRSVTFSNGSASADGYLTVVENPEDLYRQIDLRDMSTKAHEDIPEDGVLIDVKLAERLGIQPGDSLTIDCGSRITVPVGGIVEHYVYHYAYMTAETYTALTGEAFAPNEYLITVQDRSDEAISTLSTDLLTLDGVRGASNLKANAKAFRDTIDAVDAAVGVIILSAAALALVVLYNLTNINITERIRELATIKVLGFYDGEVAMYIYRENIVLTLLGIALGQPMGKYLCTWLVRTIEMDIVMFGREAEFSNYILSIVLSLAFAVIVNVMMYFRMKKIDMVQSLKSVE